ncbi:MAG: universal stress protein [Chitinophagaceae bacterium]|nr:universal stress protein [Chitinophagaceae bacterium]
MKKILVPTDFSPNAARAIDYAVQIAKLNEATIYVIHACDLLDTTFKDKLELKEEYNKTITDEAFAKLEMIRQSIEDTERILVNTQLYNGPVTDTVLLAAKEHGADLIIMGTLGHSGIKERILGSKTASVIGRTDIPVLAIPLEYEWSEPKKFLLAINHAHEATDIVDPVFDLARVFNAETEVVIFTHEDFAVAVEYVEDAKEIHQIEAVLKDRYKDIVIHPEHLSGQRFGETLDEFIKEKEIDLLAMITHKRNLVSSIFNRSMTKRMAYHTRVPLLAIPAR